MFERFTVAAREVVIQAQREAIELRHPHIGTEHVLLALLWDGSARDGAGSASDGGDPHIAYSVLHGAGLDAARVRADVRRLVSGASTPLGEEDAAALQTIGIDLDAVMSKIEESFGPQALDPPVEVAPRRGFLQWRWPTGHRPFTPPAKKVLELALREAILVKDRHLGAEHILLGLLREGDGLAAKILIEAELNLEDLRRATLAAMRAAA